MQTCVRHFVPAHRASEATKWPENEARILAHLIRAVNQSLAPEMPAALKFFALIITFEDVAWQGTERAGTPCNPATGAGRFIDVKVQ